MVLTSPRRLLGGLGPRVPAKAEREAIMDPRPPERPGESVVVSVHFLIGSVMNVRKERDRDFSPN